MSSNGNGTHHDNINQPVSADTPATPATLDTIVWEPPVRVSNRAFPGPGLSLEIVRRGKNASFTFSPDLARTAGLTDGCRVIFAWNPEHLHLEIVQGFGSKIRLLSSGNAKTTKALPLDVLDGLMQDKEVMFFFPTVIPGKHAIIIAAETAQDPMAQCPVSYRKRQSLVASPRDSMVNLVRRKRGMAATVSQMLQKKLNWFGRSTRLTYGAVTLIDGDKTTVLIGIWEHSVGLRLCGDYVTWTRATPSDVDVFVGAGQKGRLVPVRVVELDGKAVLVFPPADQALLEHHAEINQTETATTSTKAVNENRNAGLSESVLEQARGNASDVSVAFPTGVEDRADHVH